MRMNKVATLPLFSYIQEGQKMSVFFSMVACFYCRIFGRRAKDEQKDQKSNPATRRDGETRTAFEYTGWIAKGIQ